MNIMSEQVNELFTALSEAQGELRLVEKSANNPFFKSKYADLGSFIKESREVLSKHNLSVVQTNIYEDGKIMLVTILGHKSGQWIKGILPIICEKKFPRECSKERENAIINAKSFEYNSPQEMGSAITYARRYAFTAIINTCGGDDDDDGQKAQDEFEKAKSTKTPEHLKLIEEVLKIYTTDKGYAPKIKTAMDDKRIAHIKDIPEEYLKSIISMYKLWKSAQEDNFIQEIKREF